jgi:hypothetical protein
VEQALQTALQLHARERQCVLSNVPPAWVHHLQFTGDEPSLFAEPPASNVAAPPDPVSVE